MSEPDGCNVISEALEKALLAYLQAKTDLATQKKELDEDGLKKMDETPAAVWPFKGAEPRHKRWGLGLIPPGDHVPTDDHEKAVPADAATPECCHEPDTEVHRNYMEVRKIIEGDDEEGKLATTRKLYWKVINSKSNETTDTMLQAMACVKLGVLLSRYEAPTDGFWRRRCRSDRVKVAVKDEVQAFELFKRAAVVFQVPAAKYFYGQGLIHGRAGMIRNVSKGVKLLHEAGAAGVGEAFFELGSLHENGLVDGIEKSVSDALYCYEAAKRVYDKHYLQENGLEAQDFKWAPEIWAMRYMIPAEGWHTLERELGGIVSERYSLLIASQAFLFGAAAALSKTTQLEHYPPLLLLLPLLGLCLSLFSVCHNIEANIRNGRRRMPLYKMLDAKNRAYGKMLTEARRIYKDRRKEPPPENTGYAKMVERARKEFRRLKFDMFFLRWFTFFAQCGLFFTNVMFLSCWTTLLINEISSLSDNCSEWWETGCQQCGGDYDPYNQTCSNGP